jgi:hypothetical protein
MRILLDECIDWRLGREIPGHSVQGVTRVGWAGIKNGELLTLAQSRFDVFVTVDKNLPSQHDLARFAIAVVVLRAPTNRLRDLIPLVPALLAALPEARPGTAVLVGG